MSGAVSVAKLAAQVASTIGVSKVVSDIIRNNTNIVTTADAVKVWAGSFMIGAVVCEAASNSLDRQWDAVAEMAKKFKKKPEDNEEAEVEMA